MSYPDANIDNEVTGLEGNFYSLKAEVIGKDADFAKDVFTREGWRVETVEVNQPGYLESGVYRIKHVTLHVSNGLVKYVRDG